MIGLGVFQVPPEQTERVVLQAIEAGYRHFDTAACYANEVGVGRAVRRCGLAREDLFITTKLWIQDAGYTSAKAAFDRALDRLRLDYVDLYLVHQPFGDYYGAWRAMEDIYHKGCVRAIGVSNFHTDRLVDLIEHNEVVPAVNQIETHVFHQREEDLRVMRERGVAHESWSPLAEGRSEMFRQPTLITISELHGKSVAQVVLRWLIQRDIIAIPKTVRVKRMRANLDVFDFQLSEEDMRRIAAVDTGGGPSLDHRSPKIASSLSRLRFEI